MLPLAWELPCAMSVALKKKKKGRGEASVGVLTGSGDRGPNTGWASLAERLTPPPPRVPSSFSAGRKDVSTAGGDSPQSAPCSWSPFARHVPPWDPLPTPQLGAASCIHVGNTEARMVAFLVCNSFLLSEDNSIKQ